MEDALDEDTRKVVALLREAVASSGLSQAAFARALGTSPARLSTYLSGQTRPSAYFVVRAGRLGRGLGAAAERGLMSAPTTALAMREQLLAGATDWAWRMLLQGRDHLTLMLSTSDEHPALLAAWEAAPSSTGWVEWDSLLAAVVSHEYDEVGRRAPEWTTTAPLLTEAWIPAHPFLDAKRVRAQTPDWLSARNIYVPARDLVTA